MKIRDLELEEIYQFKYSCYDILCIYAGILPKEDVGLTDWKYSFKVISSVNNNWNQNVLNLNEEFIRENLQKL